jgi:hypothetical protein
MNDNLDISGGTDFPPWRYVFMFQKRIISEYNISFAFQRIYLHYRAEDSFPLLEGSITVQAD